MTDDNDQQMWYPHKDSDGHLAQLVSHRDQLILALRETDDPNLRSDLAFQLRAVTDRIEELTWALAEADQADRHTQPVDHEPVVEQPSQPQTQRPTPRPIEDLEVHLDDVDLSADERATLDLLDFDDNGSGPDAFIDGVADGRRTYDEMGTAAGADPAGERHDDEDGDHDDGRANPGDWVDPYDRIDPNDWIDPDDPTNSDDWIGDEQHGEARTTSEQPAGNVTPDEPEAVEQPWQQEWDRFPGSRDWSEGSPVETRQMDQPPAGPDWAHQPTIGQEWPYQSPVDAGTDETQPAAQAWPDAEHVNEDRDVGHLSAEARSIEDFSGRDRAARDHWYEPEPDQQAIVDRPYAWPDPVEEPPAQTASPDDHIVEDPPFGSVESGYRPSVVRRPASGLSAAMSDRRPIDGSPGNTTPNGRDPDRGRADHSATPLTGQKARSSPLDGFVRPSGPVLAVVGISLALLAGLLWLGDSGRSTSTANEAIAPAGPEVASDEGPDGEVLAAVRSAIQDLGLPGVVVAARDGVIHVAGPVPSQADYDAVSAAVGAAAETYPLDLSGLLVMGDEAGQSSAAPVSTTDRPEALQTELDRILAATPLIFNPGQAALTELHQRILNNAVISLQGYPGFNLTIAGFTDDTGDDAQNRQLSLSRAENVRAYLVSQGLPEEAFQVEARGEDNSTGSAGLAGLERRVEFEVTGAGALPAGNQTAIKVAIVAPSASNDLAFTQSMVDAVNLIASERPIELAVTDNTFVPDEAAAAVRGYAEQGFNLVIAHGSQFGAALIDIAPQFPNTAFAWGTASDTFGLPNVYAYDAAAQEGGYVLGALASRLSGNKVVGVVGPIEVGDAAQYVNGFDAGAKAENPLTNVLVTYTGSFSDIGLASETAKAHQGGGADVMTGSAQMVVGAIAAAEQQGTLWFGTQANQTSLAPGIVVASQVYHWEVAIRPIIADIEAGTISGKSYTANLANGGLVIEYNPDYPLAAENRQRADELTAAIANGSITPPR